MVHIEITGYKKIKKPNKTLYYLSAISCDIPAGHYGYVTYNGFITEKYLNECHLTEDELCGAKGKYYNVKEGNGYKSVISLKN